MSMNGKEKKIVLVTGASSGIGKACAEHLSQKGNVVYGTSRKAQPGETRGLYSMMRMDVDDTASVKNCIEELVKREKRLDVLVHCAGNGIAGAVEDTSIEEAKMQFETNFFGAFRVCKTVLPVMRAQGGGTIVLVTSMGGLMTLPFQGVYCASKFAVEGMAESLRMEVRPFGIRIVCVEPGDFHTEFTAHRTKAEASQRNSAYERKFISVMKIYEHEETHGPSPVRIARLVDRIIRGRSGRFHYTVGLFPQRLAIFLKRTLPFPVFEQILKMYYNF
jgi:NAD(P)-dependent dehydrogenase (short-subunit alcohol dehydrogenase family)